MKIKIYRETDNPLPEYQNKGDAGLDIRANENMTIRAYGWEVIGTGLTLLYHLVMKVKCVRGLD